MSISCPYPFRIGEICGFLLEIVKIGDFRDWFTEKNRCDESIFIEITDISYIPDNFTGMLKIEITKVTSLYSYIGKIIHIKPHKILFE